MKIILKFAIISNIIICLFQVSYATGIPEKLNSYQKNSPGKIPDELSAILSDSQYDNNEESTVYYL